MMVLQYFVSTRSASYVLYREPLRALVVFFLFLLVVVVQRVGAVVLVDLLSFNASTHTHQIPITQIELFTTSDVASPDLALQGRAHARPAASNSKKPRAPRHRAVAVHPAAHEFAGGEGF